VEVFDGRTGGLVTSLFAFDPAFTGGVNVAAGDVDGDGVADVVVGAGPGGGPAVSVFSGKTGALLTSFFAFDSAFTGGVRVAAGDVDRDGHADIVAGAGAGGGPAVKVFSGRDGTVLTSFFAFDPSFTGGVYVVAGDIDGDGAAEVVAGAGAGGGPNVRVFRGTDAALLQDYFAYAPGVTFGVRVGAADLTGDGRAEIVTGTGPGGGPDVQVRDGRTLGVVAEFFAFDPSDLNGVYVG
jgi:hypothetical protein